MISVIFRLIITKSVPGNEQAVARYLFNNIGKISLLHIGIVKEVGRPGYGKGQLIPITSENEISLISSDDATKKADIYVNGIGVSIKQTGAHFEFNRLQRANLKKLFETFGFTNVPRILDKMDSEILRFHTRDEFSSNRMLRDRPWRDFFTEEDFRTMLELLMLKRSPNYGISDHPAKLILEAPETILSENTVQVSTFQEYFEKNKDQFKISIRRVWYGQGSDSEHNRAIGLMKKPGNRPWVFDSVAGTPHSGWRTSIPESERKTIYLLFISKV